MTPCTPWHRRLDRKGYGRVTFRGRPGYLAHRMAYELANGPIPEGMVLDHLCRNPACVNPEHLEPVTTGVNQLRGSRATATHCVNGHPYDERNTYLKPGKGNGRRDCRRCIVDRVARYRARRAA